jgi:hypothetical protein
MSIKTSPIVHVFEQRIKKGEGFVRYERCMIYKILPSHNIYQFLSGRISSSTSLFGNKKKGSVTVEAALAVPLFFLAVVSLLYLFEIMAIQTSVRAGLQYAGKEIAKNAYVQSMILPSSLQNDVVYAIGEERLDRSIVVGGSGGISLQKSNISARTGIGKLTASYKVRIPILVFAVSPIEYKTSIRIKGWVGYEKEGFGQEAEDTVYVTETGLVYHKNYHCTYLDLSIHMVSKSEIDNLRNESGGKYYSCRYCYTTGSSVYITDDGDRYHSSVSCSGLKRTVYAIPLSEAIGKGACSRCGK